MKKIVSRTVRGLLIVLLFFCFVNAGSSSARAEDPTLNGGGATFPAPLYIKWFKDYHRKHPNVNINYRTFGSGAGISNFMAGRLDFAGSDVPMTPEEIAKVRPGVTHIPLTAGAIVLIYNLDGVKDLHLSREAYTGIFLGKVKNWQDPLIARENQGIDLPDKEINLVVRVDASGTTNVLTHHLGAVSAEFAKTVEANTKPVWPEIISEEGRLVKAVGNGGLAQTVKILPGSIGYVEYSYAYFTDIPMATLQNKAGQYVTPNMRSFLDTITAESAPTGNSISQLPSDPPGKNSYPISAMTWVLCYKSYDDPLKLKTLKDVLNYCLTEGQRISAKSGYIPLVDPLLSDARTKVDALKLK